MQATRTLPADSRTPRALTPQSPLSGMLSSPRCAHARPQAATHTAAATRASRPPFASLRAALRGVGVGREAADPTMTQQVTLIRAGLL